MPHRDPSRRAPTVSVQTVAERAGVSIATVSRVMNGVPNRASAETVRRVRHAAQELGYRPVSVGRALRERRSRLVAVLAPNLANPAMAAVAASIEAALRRQGLVMVLCDTHDVPEIQDEYLLEMRAQLVRATVLLGAVASPQLSAAAAAGEPLLFVNRRSPDGATRPFVGIDNARAGQDVAGFFLARRVPVLGLIHGGQGSSATAERVEGFRGHLADAGVPLAPDRTVTEDGLDHVGIGFRCAERLMPSVGGPGGGLGGGPPGGRCGIFCASDLIAYGAHAALVRAGLRVPEDVVLVGFDDNPLNDWLAPWLTSVRVPHDRFGDAVAEALAGIWNGTTPPCIVLGHELVARA
jgi:LacI family transcriptional regulator